MLQDYSCMLQDHVSRQFCRTPPYITPDINRYPIDITLYSTIYRSTGDIPQNVIQFAGHYHHNVNGQIVNGYNNLHHTVV